MRLQHPDKRQHIITPAGEDPIETDESGIAEVEGAVAKDLLAQGWRRTDRPKSRKAKADATNDTDAEPAAEDSTDEAGETGEEA